MPSQRPREWRKPDKVLHEIRKAGLTTDEAARLGNLMQRFLEGRTLPNDHKILRDGVQELRLQGDRRIFRLYFAEVSDGFVILCLHFKGKKKDNDRDAVDLAAQRLKDWREDRFDPGT